MRQNRSHKGGRLDGHNLNPNPRQVREDTLVPCPECNGTSQNPEAPAAIARDVGTCLTCCYPLHPRYAAHHGYVLPERRRPKKRGGGRCPTPGG